MLLKTIEEPPASTHFVVLADFVPPELVTIASRCVRVDFRAIPDDVLAARLVAEGVDPATAAAAAARRHGGDLDRARCSPPTRPRRPVGPPSPRCRPASTAPARRSSCGGRRAAGAHRRRRRAARRAATPPRSPSSTPRIEQFGERGSGRKHARGAPQARAAPAPHRRAAQPGWASSPATYRDLLVAGAAYRGRTDARRRRRTASTPRSRRSNATRTSRCCCSPCCGRCRRLLTDQATASGSGGAMPSSSSAASPMTDSAMP